MYLTVEQFARALSPVSLTQLSNDDPAAQEADTTVIEGLITDACELVDGYLRGRYSLPLDQPPTLVRQIVKDLTLYALYARRPDGQELPPAIVRAHSTALKLLTQIQQGTLTLGMATGQSLSEPGEFRVRVRPSRNNTDTFSRDVLERY